MAHWWGGVTQAADWRPSSLAEQRSDQDLILAQLHLACLCFHNSLIDSGLEYSEAREQATLHFQ